MAETGEYVATRAEPRAWDARRDAVGLVLVATAALIVLGYSMPFWVTDVGGVQTPGLDFSTDVAASWPMLGGVVLVVVGAVDRFRGAPGGLGFAAGPLVQWSGLLLLLVATTEDIRSIGSAVSYGTGGLVWLAAFLPAAAAIVLGLVEATRGGSRAQARARRASPEVGLAVAVGGMVWVGAHVLPGDARQTLLAGPLLGDVGRVGWLVGVAGSVFLAATRRTQGTLALVVGAAAAWSLWWIDAGGPETMAAVFEPWSVEVLFGLGATVAGTAAAVGLVGLQLDAAGDAPAEIRPPVSFGALVSVVLIPLAGIIGFFT